ncbi:MAG: UDP-N-acetylmuramoyl-L-alanyl-D-glutamate--2,6-diaminopimelate ligase [Saprospiraceae bacterium]|nr:UDP-N-acetylmuramoyl-L-alanyl-D-glutamate--2,6-diaminopimelate ligase [Saprospiraceae bacterium]
MKKLQHLLQGVNVLKTIGTLELLIPSIQFDSRRVEQGAVFVAVKGTQTNGHQYIEKAIAQGASAIVLEEMPLVLSEKVVYVKVENSAEALGWMASNFYEQPSSQLKVVAVTGTNGKTTTATLLYELFLALGYKAGLLSTIENKLAGKVLPATHTTPDALALNALLADMVEMGCDYVFMEASSHAIDQRRVAGTTFVGAIFTNLTHDHLDYHKTFKAYLEAKKKLFDDLPASSFALVNVDDKHGEVMLQNTKAQTYRYALKRMADFRAKIVENSLLGLHLDLNGQEFHGRLIGTFNAYNLLSVYGAATLLGQDKTEVLVALSGLKAAEGRFDYIHDIARNILGIVDYAHTPDALEKVLSTIHELKQGGSVITVVGCGGDRDKTKRPEMAAIACNWSSLAIFTADNPRSELPEAILEDMSIGIPAHATQKVLVISDRKQAIKTACKMAQPNDLILVAGKGHEKYQEIKGIKYPFDDKQVLKEELVG